MQTKRIKNGKELKTEKFTKHQCYDNIDVDGKRLVRDTYFKVTDEKFLNI